MVGMKRRENRSVDETQFAVSIAVINYNSTLQLFRILIRWGCPPSVSEKWCDNDVPLQCDTVLVSFPGAANVEAVAVSRDQKHREYVLKRIDCRAILLEESCKVSVLCHDEDGRTGTRRERETLSAPRRCERFADVPEYPLESTQPERIYSATSMVDHAHGALMVHHAVAI